MKHDYEQLGEKRFQEFCQALLLDEFPELSCLPVGMPDGGRDALSRSQADDPSGTQVFQVKYVERPDYLSDAAAWAAKTVKAELPNVARLASQGAGKYWLMTNLPASAHAARGSHDLVQAVLDDLLPIPGQCLWRADLDRRLERHWSLKWSYPDLMTGTDYVRALVESRISEESARRGRAVRAFLADQYDRDREVRFKQVDLRGDLLGAFVDVPAEALHGDTHRRSSQLRSRLAALLRTQSADPEPPRRRRPAYGGGSVLLDRWIQHHAPRVVIEGAPGQGKSTLVQYVCQVHRIRLLARQDDLNRLPEAHRSGPLRLPLKVDLRELAQWLSGISPFGVDSEPPPVDERSLEGFLAALARIVHQAVWCDVSRAV